MRARNRVLRVASLGLVVLSIHAARTTFAAAPSPATVNASCAPWDGPAFELTFAADDTRLAGLVTVAIWQAPEISQPTTFRFPDDRQQTGAAWLVTRAGAHRNLSGTVTLSPVAAGRPVTGSVHLVEAGGRAIDRTFRATWGSRQVFCGT